MLIVFSVMLKPTAEIGLIGEGSPLAKLCGDMLNTISSPPGRIQEIASALTVPVMYFFENDFSQPLPVPETKFTPTEDEKTLLKHFKQIVQNSDRQAVLLVARRLAVKR